jgi:hypothetical protein
MSFRDFFAPLSRARIKNDGVCCLLFKYRQLIHKKSTLKQHNINILYISTTSFLIFFQVKLQLIYVI